MGTIIGTMLGKMLAQWLFVIGPIFGLITLLMAGNRGRNKITGFIGGYVFGILGIVYYLIAGDDTELRVRKEEAVKKDLRKEKLTKVEHEIINKGKQTNAILIIIVIIFAFFFVRWIFLPSDDISSTENNTITTGSNTTQNSTNKTDTAESTTKTYQIGQPFSLSGDFLNKKYDWLITKSEVKKLDKYTKTCGFTRDTFTSKYGKYYVVILEGENKANEEFNIDMTAVSNLILVSKDGKKYSQNDIDMEAPYRTCNFGIDSDDANPGSIAKSAAVFDVPEQEYKVCDTYMKNPCIEGIN